MTSTSLECLKNILAPLESINVLQSYYPKRKDRDYWENIVVSGSVSHTHITQQLSKWLKPPVVQLDRWYNARLPN